MGLFREVTSRCTRRISNCFGWCSDNIFNRKTMKAIFFKFPLGVQEAVSVIFPIFLMFFGEEEALKWLAVSLGVGVVGGATKLIEGVYDRFRRKVAPKHAAIAASLEEFIKPLQMGSLILAGAEYSWFFIFLAIPMAVKGFRWEEEKFSIPSQDRTCSTLKILGELIQGGGCAGLLCIAQADLRNAEIMRSDALQFIVPGAILGAGCEAGIQTGFFCKCLRKINGCLRNGTIQASDAELNHQISVCNEVCWDSSNSAFFTFITVGVGIGEVKNTYNLSTLDFIIIFGSALYALIIRGIDECGKASFYRNYIAEASGINGIELRELLLPSSVVVERGDYREEPLPTKDKDTEALAAEELPHQRAAVNY